MKKSDLVNMVMFIGQVIKLKPTSLLLLDRVAWRANTSGVLRKGNGEKISFRDCSKMVQMSKRTLTNVLSELEKNKLIYCEVGGSGGLVISEVKRLYEIAISQWPLKDTAVATENNNGIEDTPVENFATPVENSATPVENFATPEWKNLLHNDNCTTHTHVCDSMSMDGEGCSEVKESQQEEGAQGVQGELVATTLFRQFMKCYPKRDFLDRQKCLVAWHMALQRGWLEEDIIEALKNAAAKWKQEKRKRCPNGDEFIRDEHMRTFLPDELLAKRFPGDASFYSAVAAKAIEQSSSDRLGVKRVSAASRYEAVVGYTMNMPTEIA